MTEQMTGLFLSFFRDPNPFGVGLALYFGAFWLIPYWPPLFREPRLWQVMAASAFITLAAASFIQVPLQFMAGTAMGNLWSEEVIMTRIYFFRIPQILISGLIQEGAKLIPVVLYWRRENKKLHPKSGLTAGAAAGAAFGIFEAQWAHNTILSSINIWGALQAQGLSALIGFWERFSVVAAHTAFSALAGYGLANGKGLQFYLIASFLHAFLNYGAIMLATGTFTVLELELYTTAYALSLTALALWLRWRKIT
jgi:RsiW-degrading membrane proteinase PrsW (M82 family)